MPRTSTEQVVDKGIGQKSIHSFTDGSAFCPGTPKRVSLGLRETPACIHVIQRLFRQNSQKTECVFTRCPTGGRKKFACIHGLQSEGVKKNAIIPRLNFGKITLFVFYVRSNATNLNAFHNFSMEHIVIKMKLAQVACRMYIQCCALPVKPKVTGK